MDFELFYEREICLFIVKLEWNFGNKFRILKRRVIILIPIDLNDNKEN